MELLPECNGEGVFRAGPCAFCRCENLAKQQRELLKIQRTKKVPLFYWELASGTVKTKRGEKFKLVARATSGHDWSIVRSKDGKLLAKRSSTLQQHVE
jgi:hypothetical protein